MRVIAGEVRGFQLKGPPSRLTRPMTDKVKEALFGTLNALGVAPECVLDLYAGTGGLGIEALSRGASWVDFVERQAAAAATIRENLTRTRYQETAAVHQMAVQTFLIQARHGQYDLVLMDPPYADPAIEATLDRVGGGALVQSGSIVAVGHWPRLNLPERLGRLARLRQRCHGDSCFAIYEVEETAEVGASGDGGDLSGQL